jgi:hypothetical protein
VSIWASIHRGTELAVPSRCNYCGEINTGCVCTGPLAERSDSGDPVTWFDVATAESWHDRIRVSMDTYDNDIECLLSTDETRLLIEMLQAAITRIEVQR